MLMHVFSVLFTAIYAIVCVLLVLVVLMQRSKQDGIGAAFGSGITDSMFGAQTSSVLVKATVWLTAIFFALSIILAQFSAKSSGGVSAIQQQIQAAVPPPAATAAPTVPAPAPAPAGTQNAAQPVKNSAPAPVAPTPAKPTGSPTAPK